MSRLTFPAVFNVSSLNGANGFNVVGLADSSLGLSVAGVGDVNGDGKPDFGIGAPDANINKGMAYIAFGATRFPNTFNVSTLNGITGFIINGIPGSLLGVAVAGVGDINEDDIDDLAVGAFWANNFAGAVYIIYGMHSFPSILDVSTLNGINGFTIYGIAHSQLGASIAGVGDINDDGVKDIAIGAPIANYQTGAVCVVFGARRFPSILWVSTLNGTNGFTINGIANSLLGSSVAGTGDINGDDIPDMAIGESGGAGQATTAYVVFGTHRFPSVFSIDALNGTNGFAIPGVAGSNLGHAVAGIGDVNGDGRPDLGIGAYGASNGAGMAYIIFGTNRFPSVFNVSTLDGSNGFAVTGVEVGGIGGSIAGLGDVDGDSLPDFAVGAEAVNDWVGAVYVVFGSPRFPNILYVSTLNGTNGFVINGAGGNFGISVAGVGDITGDSRQSLIIGADIANNYAGAGYMVFGQATSQEHHSTVVGGLHSEENQLS